MKKLVPIIVVAILSSAITVLGFKYFVPNERVVVEKFIPQNNPTRLTKLDSSFDLRDLNFNFAAEKTVSSVVHISSITKVQSRSYGNGLPDLFRDFFGDGYNYHQYQQPQQPEEYRQGAGSGVIVSQDGYIVTNNHVVANADKVEVTLHDKRTYEAKLIGTDPSTDIALLKIDDTGFPYINFGNSDQAVIGDWVLAVGNPFNLSSTVTAGIISAKARSIDILRGKSPNPIESFIQTDAAVNPGNSGGALVNLNGELIGINTAIATPTGTYAGYSFAVPSNLVSKVIGDLKEYGVVQRAFIGIMIRDMNSGLAEEIESDITEGVYVDNLLEGSAAEDAGIESGDIIIQIEDMAIKSTPELLGKIASYRPGDKINITLIRDGKRKVVEVTLKNQQGSTELLKKDDYALIKTLGAELKAVTDTELLQKYGLESGVQVKKLKNGKLKEKTNIKEGFIITKINNKNVKSIEDVRSALQGHRGGVMLEGVYPDNDGKYYYAFGLAE